MKGSYQLMLQEQAELGTEGNAILEKADRSAEDSARLAVINARLKTLNAEIKAEEDTRATLLATARPMAATGRISNVRDLGAEKPWGYDLAPQKPEALAMGDFLQAVQRAGTGQGTDQRLQNQAALGATSAVGADGAFLMPVTLSNRVMGRVMGGQILSRLTALPLDAGSNTLAINVLDETSRATGSRWGGVTGYWLDSGTAPTGSRPKMSRIELKLRALAALGYATNDLLRNVGALQAWFETFYSKELRFLAEDAAYEGLGAGMPVGLLSAACKVTVAKEVGQGAATIMTENIDKMWSRMPSDLRGDCIWHINQDCEPALNALSGVVGVGGVPLYRRPGGLADAPFATLYGRPVVPIEYASTLGTEGDIALVNWGEYAWIQEAAIENANSIHVAFTSAETCFRSLWYVDGQSGWKAALTPFKGANKQSPVITLGTRA